MWCTRPERSAREVLPVHPDHPDEREVREVYGPYTRTTLALALALVLALALALNPEPHLLSPPRTALLKQRTCSVRAGGSDGPVRAGAHAVQTVYLYCVCADGTLD